MVIIKLVLLWLFLKQCTSFSVCDEVDVTIFVDTDSIINHSDNIIKLISKLAIYGTSEHAGFSVIVYGNNNIPNDLDINILQLSETSTITVREEQESLITSKLTTKFNEIKNIVNTNTKSVTLLTAFDAANSQTKPNRDHQRTTEVNIAGLGSHDDDDEYLIFNYNVNNQFVSDQNSIKTICDVLKLKQNKQGTIHFLLGHENGNIDYDQPLNIICTDNTFTPKIERDTFINFKDVVDNTGKFDAEYLELVYSITCPCDVDASSDLGPNNNMVLANHNQWIDHNTIINCFLKDNEDDPQTPDLTQDSYILIKDYVNDDNTFQNHDYLLITENSLIELIKKAPTCCDLSPLKIFNIVDDNEHNTDNNYVIRRLYVMVPRAATEYIINAKLDGFIKPQTQNLCPSDANDGTPDPNYDFSYDELLKALDESGVNEIIAQNPQVRRRLLDDDFSLIGGPKSWGKSFLHTKGSNGLTLTVDFGYKFQFDVRLNIHFDWSLAPWGFIDLSFKIYGYFEATAWFHIEIKFDYSKVFTLLKWSKTLKPRVAGIAIIIRPFLILQARVVTIPFKISAGIECVYKREWAIGYYIKTDTWFRKFRSGPIQYSKTPKKECTKYFKVSNDGNQQNEACNPIVLGFDLFLEPIVGVSVYELVAVWLRVEFKVPFRIKIPETNDAICANKCSPLQASFKIEKITLSIHFGHKLDVGFWKVIAALKAAITGIAPKHMKIADFTGQLIAGPWVIIGEIKLGCVDLTYLLPVGIINYFTAKCCAVTTYKGTIKCSNQPIIDTIKQYESHKYLYESQPNINYNKVYLESGHSEFDTQLFFYDINDIQLKTADDENNYGSPRAAPIIGGDGFIQFGTFRIGIVDAAHLSISSANHHQTSMIFRHDGHTFSGPWPDGNFGLWNKPILSSPKNIKFTFNGIEFGTDWCLGMSAAGHLSITHNNNNNNIVGHKTAYIWRKDGTAYPGPRDDFSCWTDSINTKIEFGKDKYIKFNKEFGIGHTGTNGYLQQHLSIASKVKTLIIFRDDGTTWLGPSDNFGWSSWTETETTNNLAGDLTVTPHIKASTSYYFKIGGVGTSNGKYQLNLYCITNDITCGDTISGSITPHTANFFQFNMVSVFYDTVYFEACGSKFDTILKFWDMDFKYLHGANDNNAHGDYCGRMGDLGVDEFVIPGESYILDVSGNEGAFGVYEISVTCSNERMIIAPLSITSFSWSDIFGGQEPKFKESCSTPQSYGKGWCANNNTVPSSSLSVDLQNLFVINTAQTWGGIDWEEWVKTYNFYYSMDGTNWESKIDIPIIGGDSFIQFGTFRIGIVDAAYLSISSLNKKQTPMIFRHDGHAFPGPWPDGNFGLWNKPLLSTPTNIHFTNNGIEFGDSWCLGMSAAGHLSITHNNNNNNNIVGHKTSYIWRNDGTAYPGPRNDFSCWSNTYNNVVTFGEDKYIKFNNEFGIGATGVNDKAQQQLSIAAKTKTCHIFFDDGTQIPTPGEDDAYSKWTGTEIINKLSGDLTYNPLQGNINQRDSSQNRFSSTIVGRYLKFNPIGYYNWKTMRIEVTGQRILVGSLLIDAFSWSDNFKHPVCVSPQISGNAWCAADNSNAASYLQVNLGDLYLVTTVITFGRKDYAQWVTEFELLFSTDGVSWTSLGTVSGINSEFYKLRICVDTYLLHIFYISSTYLLHIF
eukprot:101386_1